VRLFAVFLLNTGWIKFPFDFFLLIERMLHGDMTFSALNSYFCFGTSSP